jgi:hypothetical protein
MGNILSLWRYHVVADGMLQSAMLRQPAILHHALQTEVSLVKAARHLVAALTPRFVMD